MVTVVLWLPGKGHYGGGGPVVPFEVIKIAIKTTGNFKIVQCVGIFIAWSRAGPLVSYIACCRLLIVGLVNPKLQLIILVTGGDLTPAQRKKASLLTL